jgi:hypothetical protein
MQPVDGSLLNHTKLLSDGAVNHILCFDYLSFREQLELNNNMSQS